MFQVLVAEDEVWIRDAIAEMIDRLAPQFNVVGEVGSGEEAWNFIQEHWPSIVVTDIMMPHRNGLWLSEQIHRMSLPIVTMIVSGYDNFQYAKQAMRYGITEYLLKPLEEEELHDALKRSVQKLEGMAELHEGVHKIQHFIDRLPDMDRQTLNAEVQALLAYIYRLKSGAPGARKSQLALLSAKWNEMFRAVDQEHTFLPFTEEDEQGVRKYFADLADAWLLRYPQFANQSVKASIKKVCDYINVHYFENFSLTRLADMSHLSVSYFSTLFKKTTGQTCLNYINGVRIQKAKELLHEPDLKIYEIADMVGYTSLPYFNRMFKQIVAVTPIEYRKRLGL
ncbi:response regulator transcription factor [Paenibacillus thalictri]|uniref:Response regulator n=1 Tax=Paenibacillus thalictri TaxID=2527873 RepID=A0A4Q9DEY0_9BACL|nr:response regulator [Paenibacillus thalictri]TBL69723.1 response regulator [Paenibacillus thalictri]